MRKRGKKGIVTIAFDDAYLDTYKHAIKYLARRGVKCTVAVPVSFIGKKFENRRVCGIRQLRGLVRQGHEIASHTLTHPNLLLLSKKHKEAAISEIAESKKKIQELLNYRAASFVFPYIKKNRSRALYLKVKDFYKSARITSYKPYFDKIPVDDPYDLVGFAVTREHSVSYFNKLVDHVHKKNLWLIEVFHLVSRKNTSSARCPKPYRFFMHIDDFKKHVDHILSKNVAILTQKDAVKRVICGI